MKLGNPAIIAAAASNPDLIKSGTNFVISTQKQAISTAKTIITVAAVGITGYFAWKKFKEWQKQQFVNKNAHLPDVQAAMIMRKAMFKVEFDTFPFSLISVPDGTDEAMLNKLALKVTSLQNVIKAYSVLFESNLALDVYAELNDNELLQFYENLNSKGEYDSQFNADGSPKPQVPYKMGQTIEVKNPNGCTVYNVNEVNGKYVGTNSQRDFKKFSERIGDVIQVQRGKSGAYYYIVDMWLSIDSIYGYGFVKHTDVKIKM